MIADTINECHNITPEALTAHISLVDDQQCEPKWHSHKVTEQTQFCQVLGNRFMPLPFLTV